MNLMNSSLKYNAEASELADDAEPEGGAPGVYQNEIISAVTVDVKGAFDDIGHVAVAETLQKYDAPIELIGWISIHEQSKGNV